ncbi:hypothetical protein FQA39_LY18939 [Lamprigera yunnana]|nr:hypothetical protein FQA39_LY18939 [Lamprigera yunnana]
MATPAQDIPEQLPRRRFLRGDELGEPLADETSFQSLPPIAVQLMIHRDQCLFPLVMACGDYNSCSLSTLRESIDGNAAQRKSRPMPQDTGRAEFPTDRAPAAYRFSAMAARPGRIDGCGGAGREGFAGHHSLIALTPPRRLQREEQLPPLPLLRTADEDTAVRGAQAGTERHGQAPVTAPRSIIDGITRRRNRAARRDAPLGDEPAPKEPRRPFTVFPLRSGDRRGRRTVEASARAHGGTRGRHDTPPSSPTAPPAAGGADPREPAKSVGELIGPAARSEAHHRPSTPPSAICLLPLMPLSASSWPR